MRLYECLLTKNPCYLAGRSMEPTGIMLHSTGANNPNLRRYVQPDDGRLGANNSGSHWNRVGLEVCVHAFVGKLADGSVASYQTLPWNHRGWHCGLGSSGRSGNSSHISIEICEDDLRGGDYFAAAYREAAELCAYLCRLHGFDPLAAGTLICHGEGYRQGIASNHADVMHWFPLHGKNMDIFRSDVATLLRAEGVVPAQAEGCQPAAWSAEARKWAEETGLMQGDGGGMQYDAALTREMAAVLLYRLWQMVEKEIGRKKDDI